MYNSSCERPRKFCPMRTCFHHSRVTTNFTFASCQKKTTGVHRSFLCRAKYWKATTYVVYLAVGNALVLTCVPLHDTSESFVMLERYVSFWTLKRKEADSMSPSCPGRSFENARRFVSSAGSILRPLIINHALAWQRAARFALR